MDYMKLQFRIEPNEEYISDVLSAQLAEIGFESFEKSENGENAFCPINIYKEDAVSDVIAKFPLEAKITFEGTFEKAKNWNEEWEKNYFSPILIGNECVIRSSFHKNVPIAKYDILIDPRMSFGTGHHSTTSLMVTSMLKLNLEGKSVLDMGCGTAVLAILAQKKGALSVLGIDIDEWAYNNALENIRLNRAESIEIKMGGAELLKNLHFDVIFANINRNILLTDMSAYAACLSKGGELYMSGFYKEDISIIEAKANELGLTLISFEEQKNWVAVRTVK